MTTTESPSGAINSAAPKDYTLDVRGVATHVLEGGPETAPALLYLHGTHLGNLWLEYHQRLAVNFHLIAVDIPGFGKTERPDWMRQMDDYILYFKDLLDALKLDQVMLAGHSLGGWMAAEMAVWYPERVSKLVLSNAGGIRVKGSPVGNMFAMNQQELLEACFDNPMAALPLMPQELNTDYFIQQYRERFTLASLAWNPHYDPKLERRLERVQCPTLVIWGANDRLIPPVYGEVYSQKIAGAELVMLEGTGHMPMFEKPQEWAEAISNFLSK
jgi:pimeloyl-ACP methyl ester carboxylesterase